MVEELYDPTDVPRTSHQAPLPQETQNIPQTPLGNQRSQRQIRDHYCFTCGRLGGRG